VLHLVALLDRDHDLAVARLVAEVAEAAGFGTPVTPSPPHVTLLAFDGVDPLAAEAALTPLADRTRALRLHAHGYGIWAGDRADGATLHVPVVRSPALEALHRAAEHVLTSIGAAVAGWTSSTHWSPHITLVADLEPGAVGRAVAHLVQHHQPSWHVGVDRLRVLDGRGSARSPNLTLRLGGGC
jgi:2'-5' RNA ligase